MNGPSLRPDLVPLCVVEDLPPPPPDKSGWPWTKGPSLDGRNLDARTPRVSLVTPSFNQGEFIEETLRSVLLQGYPNLEYVVLDGGSTDGTLEVLKRYQRWVSAWTSEPDQGQSDAIRKGMSKCTGELVNWLNADDYLLPGALWNLARAMQGQPDATLLLGSAAILDQQTGQVSDQPVGKRDAVLPNVTGYTGGVQASYFLTRAAWDLVGGVNPALSYTMDTELYHRCHVTGVHFEPVSETIAVYRRHSRTKTSEGWRQSLTCRRHFWTWLYWQLNTQDRAHYRERFRRHLSGLFLSSISSHDSLSVRLTKAALALREEPRMILEPGRLKRAAAAVLGRG